MKNRIYFRTYLIWTHIFEFTGISPVIEQIYDFKYLWYSCKRIYLWYLNPKFGVEISDLFRTFGMKIETCFDELYLYDECTTSSSYEHLHVHTMYHKTQIIMILPNNLASVSPQGISSYLSSTLVVLSVSPTPTPVSVIRAFFFTRGFNRLSQTSLAS